jgi:ABC-2 type transport system ATP-binding protein
VSTGAAVAIASLRKEFGEKVAVDGIDLEIPAAAFFGLVGRNGAGKTTTLRMCTALLPPTAGTVTVDGIDVWADPVEAKAHFGAMPESPSVFDHLTGAEVLLYNGLLRGLDRDLVVRRSEELLHVLDLEEAAGRMVTDYSHGMTKKLVLAAAMLHAPAVLFLDEPFEAIDPVSTLAMEGLLRRHVQGGGTVVFSSHVLDVVERLCDHVAVVEHGTIKANGTMAEVCGGRRLEEAFIDLIGVTVASSEDLSWLDTSSN